MKVLRATTQTPQPFRRIGIDLIRTITLIVSCMNTKPNTTSPIQRGSEDEEKKNSLPFQIRPTRKPLQRPIARKNSRVPQLWRVLIKGHTARVLGICFVRLVSVEGGYAVDSEAFVSAAFAGAGAVVIAAAEDVDGGSVGRGGFGGFRGEYGAGDCGCEWLGDEEEFEGEG